MSFNFDEEGCLLASVVKDGKTLKKIAFDSNSSTDETKLTSLNLRDFPKLNGYEIQLIPKSTEERWILYICAPSGGGKSFQTAQCIKQWKKLHPKGPVYIFSAKPKDPAFDSIPKIQRINYRNPDFMADHIDANNFQDPNHSLVVFDDIFCESDKRVQAKILSVMNSILELGRSMHISCIVTSHAAKSKDKSKSILNECQGIVVFPGHTLEKHIFDVLNDYWGLNKDNIERVLSSKSRWVCIYKGKPKIMITSDNIEILKRKGE